ncbi:serine/threonine-protein kinase [Microbacterium paraoxydans]|uniref:serine/threonine-protein kinase n=1 Tax=Microbacterium paraoxydans TaxID=199592 RepID=UPI003D753852
MWTQEATPTEALLDSRYRLGDAVGIGGMATVYRAEDIALERTVAVKIFRTSDDAVTSTDRAHSEKALLASLNHPNLVTLLDARLDPGHAMYLVMEFVPGPTLSSRLSRSPVSADEVAIIGADIASALQAAHAAGIVHRDVKPSNVLLTPPAAASDRWTAKLADFGIACMIDTSRVTAPGVVLGTLTYMAPEQLRNGEVRPAVDIYALGLVLLEALTGKPGFTPTASVETALARLHVSPEIPDTLGPDWVRLLTAMTRIDPAERPHAAEVAVELRRLSDITAATPASEDETVPLAVGQPAATRLLPIPDAPSPAGTSASSSARPLIIPPVPPLPAPEVPVRPLTRAQARRRHTTRPGAAPRRTRRRDSILFAAVVAIGAVTTVAVSLSAQGPQAVASSGAVLHGASSSATPEATETTPPAVVEVPAAVAPAPVESTTVEPAGTEQQSSDQGKEDKPVKADPPAGDKPGKADQAKGDKPAEADQAGKGDKGNGAKGKGAGE